MMVRLTVMHGTIREQNEIARNVPDGMVLSLPWKGLARQASKPGQESQEGEA